MSLFGNLPAPSAAPKRLAEEPPAEQQEEKRPKAEGASEEADTGREPGAPAAAGQEQEHAAGGPPPPPPAAPPEAASDQVAAALRKIAAHISHAKKFTKASELLRQLFSQDALKQEHGPLVFSALKAAMHDPQQAHEPGLAREYSRLFTAASKHAEIFSLRERSQLDVYGIWAVLRNQLTTDDSFQFNKVVARLKEMASALPEASEADDEVLERRQARANERDPILTEAPPSAAAGGAAAAGQEEGGAAPGAVAAAAQAPAAAAAAAAAPAAAVSATEAPAEHDPFGLDALMEAPAGPPPPPPPPPPPEAPKAPARRKSVTWSSEEIQNMRRVALLDCIDTCKAVYRNAWARTSVDLLIEHFHKLADRFAPSQRPRLEQFMRFVHDQRRIRKLGPSAKEVARDTTSFEAARAEWSKQAVSARGKVGAAGDHKSEMWLG